jgi:hypothetical protein
MVNDLYPLAQKANGNPPRRTMAVNDRLSAVLSRALASCFQTLSQGLLAFHEESVKYIA